MNLEAPSVWRIFAGNLKTITNMQKKSLASDICAFFRLPDSEKNDYSLFLKEKSAQYTIEEMVEAHLDLFAEIAS